MLTIKPLIEWHKYNEWWAILVWFTPNRGWVEMLPQYMYCIDPTDNDMIY